MLAVGYIWRFCPYAYLWLVPTFQEMRKSKLTSFDRAIYFSAKETAVFHSTICVMVEHQKSNSSQLTKFHNIKSASCLKLGIDKPKRIYP